MIDHALIQKLGHSLVRLRGLLQPIFIDASERTHAVVGDQVIKDEIIRVLRETDKLWQQVRATDLSSLHLTAPNLGFKTLEDGFLMVSSSQLNNIYHNIEEAENFLLQMETSDYEIDYFNDDELTQSIITLPDQELATQLKINYDGEIDHDPQFSAVNSAHVEILKPQLFRLISEAHNYFCGDGDYFNFIAEVLTSYRTEIEPPAEKIDFGSVFILAAELESSLEEARRTEGGGNTPKLSSKHAAKVRAILKTNRALMMSSNVGTDLVAESELFNETPEQARISRATINAMRKDVEVSEGVFAKKAKPKILAGLKGGSVKEDIIARKIAKNIAIVTVGVAVVSSAPAISLISATGALVVGVVSGVGLLFGGDKVTKAGLELSQDISPAMKAGMQRVNSFTKNNRDRIEKAGAILLKANWFKQAMRQVELSLSNTNHRMNNRVEYQTALNYFREVALNESSSWPDRQWHGDIESCDVCSRSMQSEKFMIDGPSSKPTESPWANLCVVCAYKSSKIIGWSKGQLYEQKSEGNWQLVSGGPV